MKTQEEIVQLVNTFWFKYRYDNGYKLTGSLTHMGEKDMLVKLYTQCQEDMADRKYTEENIIKAIKLARETESVRRGALSGDWDDVEKYDEMDIIYLLNKQN